MGNPITHIAHEYLVACRSHNHCQCDPCRDTSGYRSSHLRLNAEACPSANRRGPRLVQFVVFCCRGTRSVFTTGRQSVAACPVQKLDIMTICSHYRSFTRRSIRCTIALVALAPLLLIAGGPLLRTSRTAPMTSRPRRVKSACGRSLRAAAVVTASTLTGAARTGSHMAAGAIISDTQVYDGRGSFTANPSSLCPGGTSLTQA